MTLLYHVINGQFSFKYYFNDTNSVTKKFDESLKYVAFNNLFNDAGALPLARANSACVFFNIPPLPKLVRFFAPRCSCQTTGPTFTKLEMKISNTHYLAVYT